MGGPKTCKSIIKVFIYIFGLLEELGSSALYIPYHHRLPAIQIEKKINIWTDAGVISSEL